MKKLFVVLGVVAFGFAFTACKKDCKCTVTVDGTELAKDASVGELSKNDCKDYADAAKYGSTAKFDCKSE
jgi:hypothetical protein